MYDPFNKLPVIPDDASQNAPDDTPSLLGGGANGVELEPWMIVLGEAPNTSIALWQIHPSKDQALALFSSQNKAQDYALSNCNSGAQIVRFDHASLLQIMIDSYKNGIQYAALDPTQQETRQVFRLADVLQSAKQRLSQQSETPPN